MKKVFYAFILLSLLLSCSKEPEKNEIRIAISSEPSTLDLHSTSTLTSRLIGKHIFEPLFSLDESGEIKGVIAKSYSFEDNGKILVIELRENLKFSDGEDLKAEDVISSLERYFNNYEAAANLVGESRRIYKNGNNTVIIESENNLSLLPLLLSSSPVEAVIMKSSLLEKENPSFIVTDIIGSGPYKLSSWLRTESITLEKNENYQGNKEISADKLIYYFVPESITRRLGLERGVYDFINDAMSYDFPLYRNSENLTLINGGEAGSVVLLLNKKDGPLKDEDFRKGISLALDKNALLKACYGDEGYALYPEYMERNQSFWETDAINPYYEKDSSKAEIILKDYRGLTLRILTSNLSNLDKIALVIKEELSEYGIKTEIESVDFASMVEKRKDPSGWDICISAFTSVPIPGLKNYLLPSFPGWTDESVYNLVKEIYGKDEKELNRAWNEVQKELYEYVPAIILGHYTTYYATSLKENDFTNDQGFYFWRKN